MTADEACRALDSSPQGLSDAEAAARLLKDGPNTLRGRVPKSAAAMLKGQLTDPMVLILIGASCLSAFLGEWAEAAVIAVIVAANAVIGTMQERKAQQALAALKELSAPTARVLREGEESLLPARDLVRGDIVFLRDGDRVPADLRLIDAAGLSIQESSLTGESVPSAKNGALLLPADTPLADRANMAYASSVVTYGRGTGVVTAAGMATEVGAVAELLDEQDELDTPLARKLAAAGKTLTLIGAFVCLFIFAAGMWYGKPMTEQLLLSISLAISIIPEGLPAAATIIMALSVKHLARRHALIRKLPAVETLGSTTVICSDKTGTLTQNRMTITALAAGLDAVRGAVQTPEEATRAPSAACRRLICAAALCNDASFDPDRPGEIIGDPTEGALIHLAKVFGIHHETLERSHPRLFEQPFDSDRKRMTTVHRIGSRVTACTKGAPDELLPLCTSILTEDGPRPMTEEDRTRILALAQTLSGRALRVLGFAERLLPDVPEGGANVERGLTFLGLAGMIDPPRSEVKEAVRTCHEAGIRTVMITGDHRTTALAVAREPGLCEDEKEVLTGADLAVMDDAALDRAAGRTAVYARVSPADKLRIIRSLQRCGETAAMTGDGVNDAPALRAADIGVAMGVTGTDVARGAADMVLLDDKFTTIAHAIREGRRVYRNIRKVIQFLLTGNIAEVSALTLATALNLPAPLLAVHILWVNLATATLPALALGMDPEEKDVMKRPPLRSGSLFDRSLVRAMAAGGLFTALLTTLAYWIGAESSHAAGQTMAFAVLAFSQILRPFSLRSRAPFWRRAAVPSLWLQLAAAVSILFMAGLLFLPQAQAVFQVTGLTLSQWGVTAALVLASALFTEFWKRQTSRL